ncbi:MAG: NrfD/PsrC family molybdoenzyme membrane anchor subunit [Trueperaceae bacterium]|nr:NrfD/PsrC family molybdoenzyme membrane anchor subunit [Trueperaceae bacterium]
MADSRNRIAETDRVIGPGQTYTTIDDTVNKPILTSILGTPIWWFIAFAFGFLLLMLYLYSVVYLIAVGTGVWGNNVPAAWGFPIINFVWWIGIGHAGTLISAALLLFRQEWRTSINRFAEAMTLFAVVCAGLYPILHLGRPWVFYWLVPYPNTYGLFPQFRSPLDWDLFAISTYASVSLLFWFIGLIPDLATLRDRTENKFGKIAYGIASLGWRGSAKHWQRYQRAYLLLAALSFPLVLSVHSTISLDFATSQVPGWNNTIMPPYFVAGAVFAGFAMVLILAIPLRKAFGLENLITMRHLDNSAKVMLATGLIVVYGYVIEVFIAWYSGTVYEQYMIFNRMFGEDYWWAFWALIFCNAVAIQPLWSKRVRNSPLALFIISMIVSVGMWLERFVIVTVTLTREYLPSSWGVFTATRWDWALYIGSFGLFLTLWFMFIRFLPSIATSEMKELAHIHENDDAKEVTT